MNYPLPLRFRDWVAALLLGAGVGLPLLGIGSRIGMRIIALESGQTPGFSIGGSLTVVFLGMVAGAIAGLILVGVRRAFPHWRGARMLIYWIAIVTLTVGGLTPLTLTRILVFLPLTLVFAACLQWAWGYGYLARRLRNWKGTAGSPAT